MANIIEKKMPGKYRNQLRTMIAAALGLFLGLQYNDYLRKVLEAIIPKTSNLAFEGFVLIFITGIVIFLVLKLEKALDGK